MGLIPGMRRYGNAAFRGVRAAGYALRHPWSAARIIDAQIRADLGDPAYLQYRNGLPSIAPMTLRVDPRLADRPRLNVLIPGMAMRAMSGGPNTAINLVYRLAHMGVPLRFISTDVPMDTDHARLFQHFAALTGLPASGADVEIVCAANRQVALPLGENDLFFASAWWNVQMIKYALPLMRQKRFLYIIQDYEPGLYPWSTQHALALETYSLDYDAILCSNLLADYMLENRVGNFAQPGFVADHMAVFEPAIDRAVFHPMDHAPGAPRRLLFYARPTSAQRNLFELGLYALRTAVERGVFAGETWEFLFMGEAVPDVDLGRGVVIRAAPWMDYAGYGAKLRGSDIALSLMLSPHTSYPPIEMAACGRLAVTNTFGNKTAAALGRFSPNIVPVAATLDGVVDGLAEAVRRVRADERDLAPVGVPATWDESFATVLPWMAERCRAAMAQPA